MGRRDPERFCPASLYGQLAVYLHSYWIGCSCTSTCYRWEGPWVPGERKMILAGDVGGTRYLATVMIYHGRNSRLYGQDLAGKDIQAGSHRKRVSRLRQSDSSLFWRSWSGPTVVCAHHLPWTLDSRELAAGCDRPRLPDHHDLEAMARHRELSTASFSP